MTLYLIEVWQGSGWANSLRTVSTYNAQQNRTESIAQYWRGNAWQNDRRYAYAYNSRGMKTETVVQDWANNAWTIDSGWQTEYVFDALNRVSEQRDAAWNAAQGAFLPSQRLLFTYTGNNVSFSGYDVQGWVNGAWQNVFRNTGFVYTAQAKPAFYETHYWNGAAWQVYGRTTYSYAPNGTGYSYLNERSVANSWRNSTRYTKTYDAQGTELDDAWEIWQNNAWSYQEGSTRNTVGYDANNDLARSLQQAVASGAWKNIFKRFFSNYQTFTLSSRPATAVLPATLHPNPAAHAATLDLRHLRATGEVHITVLNALGQVVHQATARPLAGALRYELDLGALPAGVYTVRAASAEGAATQRLVRQ